MMTRRCDGCGKPGHTEIVCYDQQFGLIRFRIHRELSGAYCKPCLVSQYFIATIPTILIGWLGIIALVTAPVFVVRNTITLIQALRGHGDVINRNDQASLKSLGLYDGDIRQRLANGEAIVAISRDLSSRTGIPFEAVNKHVVLVLQMSRGLK